MKRLIALMMALLVLMTGCSGGKKTSGENIAAIQEYTS